MNDAGAARAALLVSSSSPLSGVVNLSGDSLTSSLALGLAAYIFGHTRLIGASRDADTRALANVLRAIGVRVAESEHGYAVDGLGARGLLGAQGLVDVGGSAMAFSIGLGLAGALPMETRWTGLAPMSATDQAEFAHLCRAFGVELTFGPSGSAMSLGPQVTLPVRLSQPVQAPFALHAGLFLALAGPATSRLALRDGEDAPGLLRLFGIETTVADGALRVPGLVHGPSPGDVAIPGDPALASLFALHALLAPGSDIVIRNVLATPESSRIIDILLAMGGNLDFTDPRANGAESIADLHVRSAPLRATELSDSEWRAAAPNRLAQLVLLAAAGAARGETRLHGLSPDDSLLAAMKAIGVGIDSSASGLRITGPEQPIASPQLPLLTPPEALALSALAARAVKGPLRLACSEAFDPVYQGVVSDLARLGLAIEREEYA